VKGKWSIWQRQGFHSISDGIISPLPLFLHSQIGIILHSYFLYQWGRKYKKGSQSLYFWRFMPKGEKILSPKQKGRTTTISKFQVLIGIYASLELWK
jgi:hypothetical protein